MKQTTETATAPVVGKQINHAAAAAAGTRKGINGLAQM